MSLFKKSKDADAETQAIDIPYVVEIERLLVDISPEAPSGEADLSADPAFVDLGIEIQGTPEREFGGKIVQEAKEPNWKKIQGDAFNLLTRSRDLRAAMFLIRALVHTTGLPGLYTGLELLGGMVEGYWDSMYPQLNPADNNDPTERINILWDLSEAPEIMDPLKQAVLFSPEPTTRVCLRDIHIATGKITVKEDEGKAAVSLPTIENIFKACEPGNLRTTQATIRQSIASLQRLETAVGDKVGSAGAPDHKNLRTVLEEMAAFFDSHLPDQPPPNPAARHRQAAADDAAATGTKAPAIAEATQRNRSMETITSRKDVIFILDQICSYYDQNEPASPVPLLLKRARQLVEKNFVEIVQDLAPEAVAQIKTLIGGFPEEK
jgi:type VI secretion system protein ImpA